MGKVTFINRSGATVDICNSARFLTKRLASGSTFVIQTNPSRVFYFKRLTDHKVTDHHTFWNGRFVIDSTGVRSESGNNRIVSFRPSAAGLVADIVMTRAQQK